jgi:hypothetical protein
MLCCKLQRPSADILSHFILPVGSKSSTGAVQLVGASPELACLEPVACLVCEEVPVDFPRRHASH